MSISTTYREMLIEDFLKKQLSQGTSLSALDVINELEVYLDLDLSTSQFDSETHYVDRLEHASATKHNTSLLDIQQDLRALYKDLLKLTTVSTETFERWSLESNAIEKQLIDLEDRITSLLLLTQDTEGYHSIIVENFTDFNRVDKDFTTAELDIETKSLELAPSSESFQRLFLNNLVSNEDVSFKIRNTQNFGSRADLTNSSLSNVFHQESKIWWTNITMKEATEVVCELLVKLTNENSISFNRIVLDLHDSLESSALSITPLYSKDNINFFQLPSNVFTLETRSNALFAFPAIEAKWIKFILIKKGPDQSNNRESFNYQIGFKNIRFYQQSFSVSSSQYFVSEPLFTINPDQQIQSFEKLTLETCERIDVNNNIKYFITTSNDSAVPLTPNQDINQTADWIPITPVNRTDGINSTVLDLGDLNEVEVNNVTISYDGTASTFVNPAQTFHLMSQDINENILDETITSTAQRYSFVNDNERILNYQIKLIDTGSGSGDPVDIKTSSITLFRNVGEQGLVPNDTTSLVRDVQKGWGYSEPYYFCVIEIQNPEGITINVGNSPIYVDGIAYTNTVDNSILTGKTTTKSGLHKIKVHKSNWLEVAPNLTSLTDLQTADKLYPFNQKLLIEGYAYHSTYPSNEEKIYTGVDLFAETLMKEISSFDIHHNIAKDKWDVFALDIDATNTHTGNNAPTQVFLLKVDNGNPDFQNERFVIRFKQINQLQSYLRLRADLITTDATTTPALFSYKIKVS